MMFSLTILLYALVCNTIIGCLLEKDKRQEKQNQNNPTFEPPLRIRPHSKSQTAIKPFEPTTTTKEKSINYKQVAGVANMFGKCFFALSVLVFNVAFWVYSINQYIQ